MLVLHAAWLPKTNRAPARLALWGETNAPAPTRRRRGPRAKANTLPHPFSASAESLSGALPLPELSARGEALSVIARLPSTGGEPQPSRPFLRDAESKGRPKLAAWQVPALAFAPLDALALLVNLDDDAPGLDLGADLRFWQAAARFALELLAGGRYRPTLVEDGEEMLALWQPALDSQADQSRLDRLRRAMPPAARALTRAPADSEPGPRALLTDFLIVVVDAFARQHADFGRRAHARCASRARTLAERWLAALTAGDPAVELPESFVEQYRAWSQPISAADGNFRLCFRLDPPGAQTDDAIFIPKARAADWALRYFLQANDDLSLLVPAETVCASGAARSGSSTANSTSRRNACWPGWGWPPASLPPSKTA